MKLKEFIFENLRCYFSGRQYFLVADLYNEDQQIESIKYCEKDRSYILLSTNNDSYRIKRCPFMDDIVYSADISTFRDGDPSNFYDLLLNYFVVPYTHDTAMDFLIDNQDEDMSYVIDIALSRPKSFRRELLS